MAPPIGYALIGETIEHSLSPAMMNAAFKALGLNAAYKLRPTTIETVAQALAEMRNGKWAGINVTMPLKTVVAKMVVLEGHAERAQSVNTLSRYGGEIHGALTDVDGVVEPLKAAGFDGTQHSALIIGGGGAARAAAVALDSLGACVHVATRNPAKAVEFLETLKLTNPGRTCALSDQRSLADIMRGSKAIIQATPVGVKGENHAMPWDAVSEKTIAFDMVYKPLMTPFLKEAQGAGCTLIEGWKMLLAQGAASLKIWTGKQPPLEVMEQALLAELEK